MDIRESLSRTDKKIYALSRCVVFCLTVCSGLTAEIADSPITIQDRGREISYVVATDELYMRGTSSTDTHKLTKSLSTKELIQQAKSLRNQTGNRHDIVLYPEGAEQTESNRRVLTRKVLVEIDDSSSAKFIAQQADASKHRVAKHSSAYLILEFSSPGDSLSKLDLIRALNGVVSANPLLGRKASKKNTIPNIPTDPLYAYSQLNQDYQWHLNNTGENGGSEGMDANVTSIWSDYLGTGITVGVVDDGLLTTHPDLAAHVNTLIDRNWNDGSSTDPSPRTSDESHGTEVAGVIAAQRNNAIGGTGVAPEATLVGLRLIAGFVDDEDEAEAMSWRNDVIQVKNNSWGPDDDPIPTAPGPLTIAAFEDSVINGRNGLGTIHLWAAGNGGEYDDNVNYDGYANSIYTIAVGAVNDKGERSSYSEPGAAKLISAPSDGDIIDQAITTTTLNDNYTNNFGGTSSATPLVAGVVALMLEANPNLGWRDVQEILIRSARKVNPTHASWAENDAGIPFSHDYGAGMVDAQLAVRIAENWSNLGPQIHQTYDRMGLFQSIPDRSSTGRSVSFAVTGDIRIEHIRLTADISHPDRGELIVTLTSPSGTTSVLGTIADTASYTTEQRKDYDSWSFMSVHHWGETSTGLWTLKVEDTSSGNQGTLRWASLEIFGSTQAAPSNLPNIVNTSTYAVAYESFYHRIYAAEDVTSYSASALPSGLSFDSASGVLSGIPDTPGNYAIPISATNAVGTTNDTLTLEIIAELPSPPQLKSEQVVAQANMDFSYQIQATNTPTSYTANPLPGGMSLDTTTGIISGKPTLPGTTEVSITATNANGTGTGTLDFLVISPVTAEYSEALDNSDLTFEISASSLPWINQSTFSQVGGDALQSPSIGDNENASFSTTIEGPGILKFWARTSTEEEYDFFRLYINGLNQISVSGITSWQEYEVELLSGTNEIVWAYTRDQSEGAGSDRVWIDAVQFNSVEIDELPLATAGDFAGLPWPTISGWKGQSAINSDGEDSIEVRQLGHNANADLSVTLEGPGTLTYRYKVSSEPNFDFFAVYVSTGTVPDWQNDLVFEISGDIDWTLRQEIIPAGTHTVTWSYEKDVLDSLLEDRVWIDQVVWVQDNLTDYENWKYIFFTEAEQSITSITGDTADPDFDRLPNLLEYGMGTSPASEEKAQAPTVTFGPSLLTIDYQVDTSKNDVMIQGAESSDLTTWNPLTHTVLSTDGTIQNRRISTEILNTPNGKRFLRLEAENN